VYARLTLLEVDTVRIPIEAAVEVYKQEVLAEVQKQPGYIGVIVMSTPLGRGAILSFWKTAEAAEAGASSGWYPEALDKYMTLFKSPPGRERYEVSFADMPVEMFTAASG
jgi:heme-degrading monooxygenase HmoA